MARSDAGISAIFASTSRSPSALFALARASAFSSRARSFIAARSAAVNPLDALPVADVFAPFFAVFLSAIAKHLRVSSESLCPDLRLNPRTLSSRDTANSGRHSPRASSPNRSWSIARTSASA